jgi:hypothetical protein
MGYKSNFLRFKSFFFLIIMLKSSPISKRNDAHLVFLKKHDKKKDYPLSKFECFEHEKNILICVKLWACKQLMENVPNFFMII